MSEDQKDTRIELGDKVAGEIELPTIDVSPFVGHKTTIDVVDEHEGNFGYYIKVSSEVVVKEGDTEVRATRIFGLQQEKEDAEGNEGKIGWGKKTKLGLFLAKMGVAHYRELVGKEIVCQTQTSDKDGKDYLTFN